MATDDKRQRGIAKFEEVMGFKPPSVDGNPFLDSTFDHLFAEIWSRPGLSVRDRRLITLTILICLGSEATLRLHMGAAMKTGQLSDEEIDELLLHIAHYGGWPPAAIASQVVWQLREEREKAKQSG